jgi:succinoglycan biosynthesis protein ExoV
MRLFAYKGKETNFGDELNYWLWDRLLPGYFEKDDGNLFLGIGSVLYDSHPEELKKIVFGAGYAGYTNLPTIDSNWRFYFVRGNHTAEKLGLDNALAIGDSGILIRSIIKDEPRVIKYEASYMPHFESAKIGEWQRICKKSGVNYIDPRWPVEKILSEILSSKLIISEAMHGVIIADSLRVPWQSIEPYDPNHRNKWQDWASALDVDISFKKLGASNSIEWIASLFWNKRRVIYAIRKRERTLRKLGLSFLLPQTARKLKEVAKGRGQLSDINKLNAAHRTMEELLERFKRDYPRT